MSRERSRLEHEPKFLVGAFERLGPRVDNSVRSANERFLVQADVRVVEDPEAERLLGLDDFDGVHEESRSFSKATSRPPALSPMQAIRLYGRHASEHGASEGSCERHRLTAVRRVSPVSPAQSSS